MFGAERALVAVGLGQVEHDPAQPRPTPNELDEQRAVAAADVDDGLAVAPLERGEPLGAPSPFLAGHRAVEDRALVAVRREPRPEVVPNVSGNVAAPVRTPTSRSADGRVEDVAEQVRELRPAGVRAAARTPRCDRRRPAPPRRRRRRSRAREARDAGRRRRPRPRARARPPGEGRPRAPLRCGGRRRSPSAFVVIAPRRKSQRTASGARSLIRVRARPRRRPRPRRSSVSARQSRSSRPSRTMPTTGGSPSRSGSASSSSTAHATLGSSASGSAPPPTRATVSSTSPPTSPASRSARARTCSTGSWSIRSTGISSRVSGSSASASVPSSAASVSLSARSARWSGWRRSFSTSSRAPDDDPRLRAAEELVPGEAHEVRARAQALGRRRLVADRGERARAEVVHEREARLASRSCASSDELSAAPRTRRRGSSTGARAAAAPVSAPIARS